MTAVSMTMAEWVKRSFGLQDVNSALEVNLQVAAQFIEALNNVTPRFDEETLTGAMLGAFVGAYPLGAAAFPESKGALEWSSYGKADRGEFGEKNAGADFALMVVFPNKAPRLAIFQAKSDASKSAKLNQLKVGQIKSYIVKAVDAAQNETESVEYRNQIVALTNTGLDIAGLIKKNAQLKDLNWIYYMCQFDRGVLAVPISNIVSEVTISINENKVVYVDVNPELAVSLGDLIKDACADDPKHWLKLSCNLEEYLPKKVDLSDLVDLVPIVVGGSGDASLNIEFGAPKVFIAGGIELTPESSPQPPATSSALKI